MDIPIRYPITHNRRFLPRITTSFIIRTQTPKVSMQGIDISCLGIMCQADTLLAIESEHALSLLLPGKPKSIDFDAKVVAWVAYRGRMAMRLLFQNISDINRLRLAKWMAHHAVVTL